MATWVVLSLAVPLGVGACGDGGDGGGDEIGTATELIDTWLVGWSETDEEAVASVFTERGQYLAFNGLTYEGEEIAQHVQEVGESVENVVRREDLTEAGDATYSAPIEFDLVGERVRGVVEFKLNGDLISTIWWTQDPEPISE